MDNNSVNFTKSEKRVIGLIIAGCDWKTIAEKCGVKESTVHSHRKNIFLKLGVNARTQVAIRVLNQNTPNFN